MYPGQFKQAEVEQGVTPSGQYFTDVVVYTGTVVTGGSVVAVVITETAVVVTETAVVVIGAVEVSAVVVVSANFYLGKRKVLGRKG